MFKKIVLGTLLVGLIGILVAGGIIRTMDKTESVAEARGQGNGRGYGDTAEGIAERPGQSLGASAQQGGSGNRGQGQGAGSTERQYPNYEAPPEEWSVVEGTVVQAPGDGVDLVIETGDGEQVLVGTGPGYMDAQGFTLQAGEQVQVQGYWEGDELKAAQVTRLQDGQTITLRDEAGRPAWAGNGRRGAERQEELVQSDGNQGAASESAAGDGIGAGQAQVDQWLTVQGTVTWVDSNGLIVQSSGGGEVAVENRPWWFAQEQGFSAQVGDQLSLVGFYENDDFEVGQITNVTSGQTVPIREESGRPLWAGRGRRGS